MRKSLLVATASLALVGGLAIPATAADDSTTLTVTTTAGTLSIDAPTSAGMSGSVATGTTITGALGTTTVTDNTGSLLGWDVTAVTGGNLVSADGDAIALSATGPLAAVAGTVTAEGTSLIDGVGVGTGGNLNATTPITLVTALLGSGGGTYTYDTGLTLVVPANTAADVYTVTITQTVS
jgi:hypothetical protein